VAIHELDQPVGDRKAQAGSVISAADGGVALREGLEQPVVFAGVDADARIFYFKAYLYIAGRGVGRERRGGQEEPDADLAAFGKFYSVADEVDEHLAEPRGVGNDMRRDVFLDVAMKQDAGFEGPRHKDLQYFFHAEAEIGVFFFQDDLPGFHRRKVEDIINNGEQGIATASDHVDVAALFPCKACLCHQGGHPGDAIHGSADLVAHIGQEEIFCAFGFVCKSGLLVCEEL